MAITAPVRRMVLRLFLQGGTASYDKWEAADTATDGSIVVAGTTCGNWTGTKYIFGDDLCDFAAMAIDAEGMQLWLYQVKALSMVRRSAHTTRTIWVLYSLFLTRFLRSPGRRVWYNKYHTSRSEACPVIEFDLEHKLSKAIADAQNLAFVYIYCGNLSDE